MYTHILDPDLNPLISPLKPDCLKEIREDLLQFLSNQVKRSPLFLDRISSGDFFHANFLEYLRLCWGWHWGVVISPTILWHLLLAEVASVVRADPETYRHLFTTSAEKTSLIISTDSLEMPMDRLVTALRQHVPSNVNLFFPSFSTDTELSIHAQMAVFADICSPFYSYSIMACGIPKIRIEGELEDWSKLVGAWKAIADLLGASDWTRSVHQTLRTSLERLEDASWWRDFFMIKQCGSGSGVVDGWILSLYHTCPRLRYVRNFSTSIGKVPYRHLQFQRDFVLQSGLFSSKFEDGFMVPSFGYVVHETTAR